MEINDQKLQVNYLELNCVNKKDLKTNKYNNIYTYDDLKNILTQIEDFLLEARNIVITEDRLNILLSELFKIKFTYEQMSFAKLWIKFGKFPQTKKEIDLSDFFPTKESLLHLKNEYVSKEYFYKQIQILKNENFLEMQKIKHIPLDPENSKLMINFIELSKNHLNEVLFLKEEILKFKKENAKLLKRKIYYKQAYNEALQFLEKENKIKLG